MDIEGDVLPLEQITALHTEYGEYLLRYTSELADLDPATQRWHRQRLAEYCDQLARLHEDEADERRRHAARWRTEPH